METPQSQTPDLTHEESMPLTNFLIDEQFQPLTPPEQWYQSKIHSKNVEDAPK